MTRRTKVDRLLAQLKEDLHENLWQAGQRFYSEHQLCTKYGLSRQTVRKATGQLTEEGYLERIKGSGTYVTEQAVSRRHTKTHSIGILVTYLSDYIFPIIIKELERCFSRAGFTVQLASTGNSSARERELLTKMLRSGVDGIILEPTKSALPNPNLDMYKELEGRGFPMIYIHSRYPGIDLPLVGLDDERAGYLACKHLLDLGHRRIAAILKSDDLQGHARYRGLLKAFGERDMTFNDQNVYWYSTEDIGTFEDLSEPVLARLRGSTGLVVYNDQIAILAEQMLLDAGIRIPEDMAVVSIDDSKYASLAPVPLTSVRSPCSEIGRIAADHLLRLIGGENFEPGRIFVPTVIKRRSTASPAPTPIRRD